MGRKFQEGPEKNCDYCGKPLERKRYKNSLEDMGRFKERRYCDKSCFGNALVKEEVTLAGYRARAKKFRKDVCESCGSKENLDTHHRDGNVENNDPQNIATLCETCHTHLHETSGYPKTYSDYLNWNQPIKASNETTSLSIKKWHQISS